jgi:hypothetical protein
MVHEYGHVVHGAKSGHHIYIPGVEARRQGFLEGLASFFNWSKEQAVGYLGTQRWYRPYTLAEGMRGIGPEGQYEDMAAFLWDMADYVPPHVDAMDCPIDPENDTSTAMHKGIFDSLANSPDTAPAWVAHWIKLHNLQGTSGFDVVRAIANHHKIIEACSPPQPTPTGGGPEPAPVPCPSGPPDEAYICTQCRQNHLDCLTNCAIEKITGVCGRWCYWARVHIPGTPPCP